MKKLLLLFTMVLTFGQMSAQSSESWQKITVAEIKDSNKIRQNIYSENQQLFQLNEAAFRQSLVGAPEKLSGNPGVVVSFPNVDGDMEQFLVWETSNFAPGLRARFPQIKSYVGKGKTDMSAFLNFSVSPEGIQTMVHRAGEGTEFIESYTTDHTVYVLFDSKSDAREKLAFACGTPEADLSAELQNQTNSTLADNGVLKVFRLALSCTSEYTSFYGGTIAGALGGMNATMTRVNAVFERDFAVKLEIIDNNELVIYTNAATDPYDNAVPNGTGDPENGIQATWNAQLQNTLTAVLGNAAYDIGHLFGASGGGGNAGCIGCVCVNNQKGSGFTSPSNNAPVGDTFDIDFVAHEMGHQLGANHTYSYRLEGAGVNIEPGSGTTIMGYAGVTGLYDVQQNSDPFFASRSILQVQTNLLNKTCGVNTQLVNSTPTANAGPNYNIPFGTAFILTGEGSDADAGDVLTYLWEQNDNANASVVGANSSAFPDKRVGPNFRTFTPTDTPIRYMPQLSSVLAGSLSTRWESVQSAAGARALNFTLTVRDNALGGGQTKRDATLINVSSAIGPFNVTSQNAAGTVWTPGTTESITWNVNNTTSLPGSAEVNIKLSVDGGLTFPITLAGNTPNDGQETITVPALPPSLLNRIKIEPVGNIYYAVNAKPISIGYECNVASVSPNIAIPDGTGPNVGGPILSSTIEVTESEAINNMKLNLTINHEYTGNLVIKLIHPDGTSRTMWNRTCNNSGGFQGIDLTFADGSPSVVCSSPTTGIFRSSQLLAPLNGKPTNGTWTLTVQDFSATNTGTLVSWGVDFGCTLGNSNFEQTANFAIYPNPNSGSFTVQFNDESANEAAILVHDIRGRKIFEKKYTNNGLFSQNIQLNSADRGIYLVTVVSGDHKEVKKIVVE